MTAEEERREIREAIEQEREERAIGRASLRGCRLSETLRHRAHAYAAMRRAAGADANAIARELGVASGTVEHWLRAPIEVASRAPEEADQIRREIADERKRAREARTDLRLWRVSEALKRRAEQHARVRAAAGAKLARIAGELGIATETLKQWMQPPSDAPVRIRPVRIIGPLTNQLAELTGPRLVLPSGVQIVGLDVDQMAALAKRFG